MPKKTIREATKFHDGLVSTPSRITHFPVSTPESGIPPTSLTSNTSLPFTSSSLNNKTTFTSTSSSLSSVSSVSSASKMKKSTTKYPSTPGSPDILSLLRWSANVDHFDKGQPRTGYVTYYSIQVKVFLGKNMLRSWNVLRRYSEFKALERKIRKGSWCHFKFPSKKRFYIQHTPEFLEKRRKGLNRWLQGTLFLWQSSKHAKSLVFGSSGRSSPSSLQGSPISPGAFEHLHHDSASYNGSNSHIGTPSKQSTTTIDEQFGDEIRKFLFDGSLFEQLVPLHGVGATASDVKQSKEAQKATSARAA